MATRLTAEELKQISTFRRRSVFFCFVTIILFLLLASRFFYLQILEYDNFIIKAEANRKTETAHPPRRGIIMDKNGELLAANEPIYTLEITPGKVVGLAKTIEALEKIIPITKYDKKRFYRLKDELPRLSPVPLKSNLTDEDVARFIAQAWKFPGVEVRSRMHRYYPQGKDAAHVVGYIGRISQRDQAALEKAAKKLSTPELLTSANSVSNKATKMYCTANPVLKSWRSVLPAVRFGLYLRVLQPPVLT